MRLSTSVTELNEAGGGATVTGEEVFVIAFFVSVDGTVTAEYEVASAVTLISFITSVTLFDLASFGAAVIRFCISVIALFSVGDDIIAAVIMFNAGLVAAIILIRGVIAI